MTDEQRELREERQAICEVEKVPKPEIERIFFSYPSLYGIQPTEYSLETVNGRKPITA